MASVNQPKLAIVLGFLAAPVVPAVAFALAGALVGTEASPLAKAMVAGLVYFYSLFALALAIPAFAVLNKFGQTGPVVCTLSGGVIASVLAILIATPIVSLLPLWAGSGAGGGLMFWLVRSAWVRRKAALNES